MDIITACVLGGISITGDEGKILGVIIGVLTIGVLSNGMVLLGVNEFWQMIVKGAVLLIAVTAGKFSGKTGSKMSENSVKTAQFYLLCQNFVAGVPGLRAKKTGSGAFYKTCSEALHETDS